MLISTRCIHGFISNLIKKSWTDSNPQYTYLISAPVAGQSSDCYDVYKLGLPLPGVYDLKSLGSVQCLEGGWTSIQHRGQYGNPKDYFSKKWTEYAQGFGSPGKNESKAEEGLGTI